MCLMSLSLVILLYSFQRTKAPVFCSMGKEISSVCIPGDSDSFVLPSIFIAQASGPRRIHTYSKSFLGFLLTIEDSAFLHCSVTLCHMLPDKQTLLLVLSVLVSYFEVCC